jgi:DNA (cytosine-5)-methyltransferase 1
MTRPADVAELCAGPGGWGVGAAMTGYEGRMVGLDVNADACRTATAAGHERICADVSTYPTALFSRVDGLIGSPPCPPWSQSGSRLGPLDRSLALARIGAFAAHRTPAVEQWNDDRSFLSAEPMRWAVALRPRWIALEQVPGALALWQHIGGHLETMGYTVATGVLRADAYGVPQTRRRAVLIARRDAIPAGLPAPTHQAHGTTGPLPAAVTMHNAIGWGLTDRPAWTVTGGGTRTGGAEVFGNAKCRTQIGNRRPTVAECAVLQSFPADYPFTGDTAGSRHQQVGDAIPPLLAAAILRPLIASPALSERSAA